MNIHEEFARNISKKCGHLRFRAAPRFDFAARRAQDARIFVNENDHYLICAKQSDWFTKDPPTQNNETSLTFKNLRDFTQLQQRIILKHYSRILVVSDRVTNI